jgi:uncharacterized protein
VGCGRTAPKDDLLRLALTVEDLSGERRAVLDRDGRMGGRGAYLCRREDAAEPRPECLSRAIRRGSIARTLRSRATLDPKLVESVGR